MNAFAEILSEWNKLSPEQIELYLEPTMHDSSDHILWVPLRLRRTYKTACKMCGCLYSDYLPEGVLRYAMVCSMCSHEIWTKAKRNMYNFFYKLNYVKVWKTIHEEILEIGMHPDRTAQTQLFEYNWIL